MTRWSLICGALLLAACASDAASTGGEGAPEPATAAPPSQPAIVAATTLDFTPTIVLSGDLEPDRMAMVGFAVGGTLDEVVARRGDRVSNGQVLGRLGADVARATLAQARAGLAAAQAQLQLAEDAHGRFLELQGAGAASAASLRQSTANRDLALAQADAAQAQLEAAETNVRLHVAEAPFDGLVTRAPDGPGISVQAGMPMFVVERTNLLVLRASVTPAEARDLRAGLAVTLNDAERGVRAEGGRVRLVLGSADPATHRVPVEVEVDNADGRFVAHSFVRGTVVADPRPALEVPASAVTRVDGSHALWVRTADGRATRLAVRLLDQRGATAVVERTDGGQGQLDVLARPDHDLVEGRPVGGGA